MKTAAMYVLFVSGAVAEDKSNFLEKKRGYLVNFVTVITKHAALIKMMINFIIILIF